MTTTAQKRNETVDTVTREVRRTKVRLAEEHGYDVHRIAVDARVRQKLSGQEVVSLSRKVA